MVLCLNYKYTNIDAVNIKRITY